MKPIGDKVSINLHMTGRCNMRCLGCFARFGKSSGLGEADWLRAIELLDWETKAFQARKLNFVGGEPTLLPYLSILIRKAKSAGFVTGVVSNGWLVTPSFIEENQGALDWLGISVDSLDDRTNLQLGRAVDGHVLGTDRYRTICEDARACGMKVKINTVVSSLNQNEDFNTFIAQARPDRWKTMQYLRIRGQNWRARILDISSEDFARFQTRHRGVPSLVKETNEEMLGSYIMVDPTGRPYENVGRRISNGKPILQFGLLSQLDMLGYDIRSTEARGGFSHF